MASANNLGTAYIRIAPQMKGIQSTITSALGGVGSKAAASFSNNFTAKWGKAAGAIAGITSAVTTKALGAITNSIDGAIKRVDILNAFPKIMKNLGFETKESDSALTKLSDRIEGLPTTLDEIVTYTQRLASSTGNLNKGMYNATNLAIAFNDAALAGGKGQYEANRAFEQFVQVVSRGRPSMQDWKIMMEVMPGQLAQLAKYMGKSNKSLQQFAKDAKKTVKDLDGMDLYNWISEDKNAHAKERLAELQKAMIDLDNKGGAGIVSFKDQVGDATHTIGNALRLIPVRITKAMAQVIQEFGTGELYSAIDSFTQSFKKAGEWVIRYIVPPIKKEVIPVVKSVVKAIKNVITWVAKTQEARDTLGALLKAFIAFKVVTSVISTIKAVGVALAGIGAIMIKTTATVSTFTGVLGVGGGLGGALSAATARSAQFATAGKSLSASMTVAGASVTGLTTKLVLLTAGLGAVALAIGAAVILFKSVENADTRAANAARRHQEMLISEENSVDAINRSMRLEKELLDDVKNAKNKSLSAEKEEITTKKEVAQAQAELTRLTKEGKKGTDEYRLAEIELAEATNRHSAAVDKLKKAKKEEQTTIDSERRNHFTSLQMQNAEAAAANLRKKNYAAVALQLDNLSKKTYTYRDANGKLVQATKEDMTSAVDYISQQLGREDEVWRKIREDAAKNGTSFAEAVKKYGAEAGHGLMGNFAVGVTKYTPLATEATKASLASIASALSGITKMATSIGRAFGINLGSGISKGIESKAAEVQSKGTSIVKNLARKIDQAAQVNSPSKLTARTGRYIAEGLIVGMEQYQSKVDATARDVMQSMLSQFNGSATAALGTDSTYRSAYTQGTAQAPAQVIQNNTFNQVANDLDVKEASRLLGWQVATTI